MRPPAPALDVIAAQTAANNNPTMANQPDPNATAAAESSREEDSRSSSSTNSPAPVDNDESDFFLGPNDSESSFGVLPNIQDMQVNDDECIPPIGRLPNEILISIFARLSQPSDLLHAMLTCRRFARNVVEILWHRPTCTSWPKHTSICNTLAAPNAIFAYADFIKRLNLATLAKDVNDGSVFPLAACNRVERLTLTSCNKLTDLGLTGLVKNNHHLLALDISGDKNITSDSINALAENCKKLQGLNITGCDAISNNSLINLARNCRFIKRLKLNECKQINDEAVLAFANGCPNLLEIDLYQCELVGNEPVTALFAKGQSLRELRLASCTLIDDSAFLSLPPHQTYEHLRILDLTSCFHITDHSVEKIISIAPRLRNLVLAKCANITDVAVNAICKLSKNLHYLHLGHCREITDEAVKNLVKSCNRIRYIDLGCCLKLTDDSVTRLATLPKLKRIGLVKCNDITDDSIYALAKANDRSRQRRDHTGNPIPGEAYHASSLERVHLSYCTRLTLRSIIRLLNACPKLTHLSLTGVSAFQREDLEQFCRDAPPDFTPHQRDVFCVFSGQGVVGLRRYLNHDPKFATLREGPSRRDRLEHPSIGAPYPSHAPIADVDGFDEQDTIEDDDMGDGSEINLDTQALGTNPTHNGAIPPPPPPPPRQQQTMFPVIPNPNLQPTSQLHYFTGIDSPAGPGDGMNYDPHAYPMGDNNTAWTPLPIHQRLPVVPDSYSESSQTHLPDGVSVVSSPSATAVNVNGASQAGGSHVNGAGPSTASMQARVDDDDESL